GTGAPPDSPWPRAAHRMTRYRRARRAQFMTRKRSSCSMLLTRPWPQKNGRPSPWSDTSMSTPRTFGTADSLACRNTSRRVHVRAPGVLGRKRVAMRLYGFREDQGTLTTRAVGRAGVSDG